MRWSSDPDLFTNMTTTTLLRTAAGILLLFALGHWFFSPWAIGIHGDALEALTAAARTDNPVFGFRRSYWDFHVGFGHMVGVALLMQAAVLWVLAGSTADASSTRRLLAVLVVANAATAALQVAYFFWPPIILSVLATATLTMAWLKTPSVHAWPAASAPASPARRSTNAESRG